MAILRDVGRALLLGLLAVLMVGCSHPPAANRPLTIGPQSSTPAPSTSTGAATTAPSSAASADQEVALAGVRAEISDFLTAWRDNGYAEASRTYLDPSQWLPPAEPAPTLTSARIVAFRPQASTSTSTLVVEVDPEMTFSSNPGAWGNGTNSRFVTATARASSPPYVLAFSTSQ